MKFKNAQEQNIQMIETLCLILSLGAILLQIWILLSSLESFLEGHYEGLLAGVFLSGAALFCCGLMAWTTRFSFVERKENVDE